MTTIRQDKELEEFRSLMEVPSTFEEGFSWTALAGAVFVALLMVPGAIYMGLLAGQGIGQAAQWVTIILFLEVARRAHKTIKRAELFVLFYMAGAAMGSPFSGLLWNQFFVQSQNATAMGVTEYIPSWFAPSNPDVLAAKNFFDPAWYPAIGMVLFGTIIGRFSGKILTYGLFRMASDIEKLPFPMAPVSAQGILALAEQQTEETPAGRAQAETESWRWRVFAVGGVLGLAFGALYLALPAISSAILGTPIQIFPIPWVDWTDKTGEYLPAVATGLSFDLTNMLFGMVMPFFAMLGSFVGLMVTLVVNPVMYHLGFFPSWNLGDKTVRTLFSTNMDFYFSFGIGIALAVALVGFWGVYAAVRNKRKELGRQRQRAAAAPVVIPKNRGDIPTVAILATYLITSMAYILLSGYLIDWHRGVMICLVFFAYVYTPVISYVTARLEGITGQTVEIPMVREAAFILSGYTGGVKVWFLPTPLANYGSGVSDYRVAELTGTRFWSIWKTELILVPIVLVASIAFSQFIWSLAPIPGPEYPFAQTMWEYQAASTSIILTSTLGRFSAFQEALNFTYIGFGAIFGIILFATMFLLKLPIFFIYGVIVGIGRTMPHIVIPQFIGALIGRYYFQRRMGLKWRQYIPVVAAGFSCGMGLVTVLGVGANFLAKAVIKIPF